MYFQPENVKKNRYYPHVLPYDHSRVVLNELANATGSDYINASTIVSVRPRTGRQRRQHVHRPERDSSL